MAGNGGLVFHDATTMKHAKKALTPTDGIIAVSGGAGGHAGTYNPFAFVTELRQIAADKTIILAGAISNGQSVAGAIAATQSTDPYGYACPCPALTAARSMFPPAVLGSLSTNTTCFGLL